MLFPLHRLTDEIIASYRRRGWQFSCPVRRNGRFFLPATLANR
ncbi:hypothetical protein [Laribacter hongkongensis]|nr:hypothetical protein [Laribacter hongkongensis]